MSRTDPDTAFEERLRAALNRDATPLDGATRSRLNRARQAALAELDGRQSRWFANRGWLSAGGALAVAVLLAVLLRPATLPTALPEEAAADDIEIMLSEGDLELYEELEFYAWVELEAGVG